MSAPVAVVMGSDSDLPIVRMCLENRWGGVRVRAPDEYAFPLDPRCFGDIGKDAVDVVQQQGPEIDGDEKDARAAGLQPERVGFQVIADVLDGVVVVGTLDLGAEFVIDDLPC